MVLVGPHHAALPVNGKETGAALEPDNSLSEVMPTDLESETQN